MLTADALAATLSQAQKAANCGRFCRSSATTEAGTYVLEHHDIGTADTQRVYANAMLLLTDAQLQPHLVSWLDALHKRQRLDLNEAIS